MSILTALVFLFLGGCQSGSGFSKVCRDYCKNAYEGRLKSVSIPGDIRCFDMESEAINKGAKQGYCAVSHPFYQRKYTPKKNPITGEWSYGPEPTPDPDPDKCNALIHAAKQKCKLLPPDPSMMNKTVSGTTLYEGDKVVMINGQPVINGKPCTCD